MIDSMKHKISSGTKTSEDFLTLALREMHEISKNKHAHWSPVRRRLSMIFSDNRFEYLLCFTIFLNLLLLVWEAQESSTEGYVPSWIINTNTVMVFLFAVELCLRVFTFRAEFFDDVSGIIDGLIVVVDITCLLLNLILTDLPAIGMLRILRLIRLARMSVIVEKVPQLHVMVTSLAGALTTLWWGLVMLVFVLAIWGILAVEILKPITEELAADGAFQGCERCHRAFSSVWSSVLTFVQQIVAGDSWGAVTIPILEHEPATVMFFGCVFVSLDMAILNMILASVVDAVSQARLSHDEYVVREKRKEISAARKVLERCCQRMDKDGKGTLSMEDLHRGFANEPVFRMALEAMDVRQDDLPTVWSILDTDKSGDVSYSEFCDQIHKMKSSDTRTMMVFMKYYVGSIHKEVHETLRTIREDVLQSIQVENKELNNIETLLHDEIDHLGDGTRAKDLSCVSSSDVVDEQVLQNFPRESLSTAWTRKQPPDNRNNVAPPLESFNWTEAENFESVSRKLNRPAPGVGCLPPRLNYPLSPILESMKDSLNSMKDLMRVVEASIIKLGDVETCSATGVVDVSTIELHETEKQEVADIKKPPFRSSNGEINRAPPTQKFDNIDALANVLPETSDATKTKKGTARSDI